MCDSGGPARRVSDSAVMQVDLMSPSALTRLGFEFPGDKSPLLTRSRPSRFKSGHPPPLNKRLSGSLDSIMTSIKMELRMDVTALGVRKRSFNNLAAETVFSWDCWVLLWSSQARLIWTVGF